MNDQSPSVRYVEAPIPEPSPEQEAFINDRSDLLLLRGPPRAGKSTALWLKAVRRNTPVMWAGLWREAGGLPRGSRVASLTRLVSELYLRRHGGLTSDGLRQVDMVEYKRIFTEMNRDLLPGHLDLWFIASLAVKRSIRDGRPAEINSVLTRLDLKVEGQDTRAILGEAISRTDTAMMSAGMIWPHDLLYVYERAIHAKPRLIREALGGLDVLCVDDVQLLTTIEWKLLIAFAKAGLTIWATLGPYQCINLRDGSPALGLESRLTTCGFNRHTLQKAQGLTPRQGRILCDALGIERIPPFEGVRDRAFDLQYIEHAETEALLSTILKRCQALIEAGARPGQIAILTPLPDMTRYLTQKLLAVGLPVEERGRGAGENAPGFIVCMAVAKAINDAKDTVAMRQVAYLWVDDSQAFEKTLRASVARSLEIVDAAQAFGIEDEVKQMIDWLETIETKGPGSIAESVRQAPLWPADPANEEGLRRFDECIERLQLRDDWASPSWLSVAAMTAELIDDRPIKPDVISVLSIADSRGSSWDYVEVVGYSEGLMPGPCLRSERDLETHMICQAMSRATRQVALHHSKKLKMGENLPAVSLKPSSYNTRLGVNVKAEEQDLENVKFKPREKMKY